ncbi:MAG: hypothetical protein MZV70_75885 [Desulfobacterales bacterium]|nr:hypothetical protein [Desulfobacterales bacterium]
MHSMAAGRKFGQIDLEAADNFARAAEQAQLKRIVYLGGLVPTDADSEHLISRRKPVSGCALAQCRSPRSVLPSSSVLVPPPLK